MRLKLTPTKTYLTSLSTKLQPEKLRGKQRHLMNHRVKAKWNRYTESAVTRGN